MKKQIITSAITLLSISTAFGQNNFAGTWIIKQKTSLSGRDYVNSIAKQITVQQTTDSIKFIRTSVGANGEDMIFSETASVNGNPVTIHSVSGRKETVLIKWVNDQHSFTETATFSKEDNENDPDYQRSEVWDLSADGKALTVVKSFQSLVNPDDKWSVKGMFEKQ